MRRLLLFVSLVLAFSFTALAQSTGTTGTQNKSTTTTTTNNQSTSTTTSEKTPAAKESQLTGCLGKGPSGEGYTLTNGRYKKGVDVKSDKDLSAHVGHKVKLTGTWEKPAAGGKGSPTFVATDMTHIAATCKVGDEGEPAKAGTGKY